MGIVNILFGLMMMNDDDDDGGGGGDDDDDGTIRIVVTIVVQRLAPRRNCHIGKDANITRYSTFPHTLGSLISPKSCLVPFIYD